MALAAVRAAVALALVAAAAAAHHVLARRRRPPSGWLVVDAAGVHGARGAALVDWKEPFGATVLATPDRSRFAVALTSARATRMVAVRVLDPGDAAEAPSLADRAVTAADSDLREDDDAALCAADAERLLARIARHAPGALDRIVLSDAAGEPIVLDRGELRVGGRRVDLQSALEWRPFVFQEPGAGAQLSSAWQATWVRQADVEIVLVAPLLADVASFAGAPDARLMQAPPGDPPMRDLRRAIDHVFHACPCAARSIARRASRGAPRPGAAAPSTRRAEVPPKAVRPPEGHTRPEVPPKAGRPPEGHTRPEVPAHQAPGRPPEGHTRPKAAGPAGANRAYARSRRSP